MKNKMLSILLLILTFPTPFSNAQSVKESGSGLSAEINLIQNSVDQYIRQLQDRAELNTIEAPEDYLAQLQEFNTNVTNALGIFQAKLMDEESGILRKFVPLISKYNRIASDNEIDSTDRNAMLDQTKTQLINQAQKLSTDYFHALNTLFNSLFDGAPIQLAFGNGSIHHLLIARIDLRKIDIVFFDGSTQSVNDGIIKKMKQNHRHSLDKVSREYLFQNYYYYLIKGSCKSETCVNARAGDYAALIRFFAQKLYQPITVFYDDTSTNKVQLTPLEHKAMNYTLQEMESSLLRQDFPERLPFE